MWKIAPSTHQFLYFMPKKLHKLEVRLSAINAPLKKQPPIFV